AISLRLPIIFPAHPRTMKMIDELGLGERVRAIEGLRTLAAMGYLDFLKLLSEARMVLTDSGGIQEETTVLGIPCITLRENTERPITNRIGTNVLVGRDAAAIRDAAVRALTGETRNGALPEKWDGLAAERIVRVLLEPALAR